MKTKIGHRIAALMLAGLMCFTMIPTAAFALRLIGETLLRQDGRTYTIGSSASLRWAGGDRQ